MDNKIWDNIASLPGAAFKDITEKPKQDEAENLKSEVFSTGEHTAKNAQDTPDEKETKTPPIGEIPKEKVTVGKIIEGEYALDLINIFLPSILVALVYALGIVMKKEDWELNAKEKKILAIPMQACLDTITIDFSNPWVSLAVVASLIYGAKIADKIPVGFQRVVKRGAPPPPPPPDQQPKQQQTGRVVPMQEKTRSFETGEEITTTRATFDNNALQSQQQNDGDEKERNEKLENNGEWTPQEWELILLTAKKRNKGRTEARDYLLKKKKIPIFKL